MTTFVKFLDKNSAVFMTMICGTASILVLIMMLEIGIKIDTLSELSWEHDAIKINQMTRCISEESASTYLLGLCVWNCIALVCFAITSVYTLRWFKES